MGENIRTNDWKSPQIMGILNVSADSFFDGGKYDSIAKMIIRVGAMLNEGARIIDIGACSTRPGAQQIDERSELDRLIPAITAIRKKYPKCIISADTYRSKVALNAVKVGANMINDISGGGLDPEMFRTVAKLKVPYVLMHMKGTPENMQVAPDYQNIVEEVEFYFKEKINQLNQLNFHEIIIDPGFGFGKTVEHNYQLLKALKKFKLFNRPILVGMSRKSMINKVIGSTPETALNGTSVLNTIALLNGASILRVHDVKEGREVIDLVKFYQSLV